MDLAAVHKLLDRYFDEEELRTLCFQLGIAYDDLSAFGRTNKARELILLLDRLNRLDDLQTLVIQKRPNIPWPSSWSMPSITEAPSVSAWQLSQKDFDRLVTILQTLPDFRTSDRRIDFLDDVFIGSPRKSDILGLLDVSGSPRGVAVRLVTRLTQFGQDEPGQETLGILINRLLAYLGSGVDADFLHGLFNRYPLKGTPLSTRGVDNWRGQESPEDVQEKVIGENTLRDVRLLEMALEAARAVVRIRTADGLGSGFVAGRGLVLTNHHVISSVQVARSSEFTFNYQLDRQGLPAPVQTVGSRPNGLFYTNPDLDVTVVEITEVPLEVIPLTLVRQQLRRDERVNIIQHPGGHYKKISMQNNFIAYADARLIQYLTTTEPGSSGSPVFDNDFVVVGIHHSGGMLLEPGGKRRYLRNAGSSMIAVLEDLQNNATKIYERLKTGNN